MEGLQDLRLTCNCFPVPVRKSSLTELYRESPGKDCLAGPAPPAHLRTHRAPAGMSYLSQARSYSQENRTCGEGGARRVRSTWTAGPGALTGKRGFSTEEWGESEQAETIDAHYTCCSRFTPFPFSFHFCIQSYLKSQIRFLLEQFHGFIFTFFFFFRLSWGGLSISHFPSLVSFLLFTVSLSGSWAQALDFII